MLAGIRIDCPHMLRAKLEAVAVQPKPVLDNKAGSFGGRTVLEREAAPSGGPSTQQLTLAEVAKHKTAKDAWIVLHGKVYDVTSFLSSHPVRIATERADTRGALNVLLSAACAAGCVAGREADSAQALRQGRLRRV